MPIVPGTRVTEAEARPPIRPLPCCCLLRLLLPLWHRRLPSSGRFDSVVAMDCERAALGYQGARRG